MSKLLEVMAVMCELTGTEWSEPTVKVIERELSCYPLPATLQALERCQRELRHKVTLADILDRIPGQHMGVEQAWGLISKVMSNEQVSICWTDEMQEAYGAAAPLADDPVAARMAFKEVYSRVVSEARAMRKLPKWTVSLGWDKALRNECLKEAEKNNLISAGYAQRLLAYDVPDEDEPRQNGFIHISHAITGVVGS